MGLKFGDRMENLRLPNNADEMLEYVKANELTILQFVSVSRELAPAIFR